VRLAYSKSDRTRGSHIVAQIEKPYGEAEQFLVLLKMVIDHSRNRSVPISGIFLYTDTNRYLIESNDVRWESNASPLEPVLRFTTTDLNAIRTIAQAGAVGFGFHGENIRRLDLSGRLGSKKVYASTISMEHQKMTTAIERCGCHTMGFQGTSRTAGTIVELLRQNPIFN
jgi:hypothetical protein